MLTEKYQQLQLTQQAKIGERKENQQPVRTPPNAVIAENRRNVVGKVLPQVE